MQIRYLRADNSQINNTKNASAIHCSHWVESGKNVKSSHAGQGGKTADPLT